MLKRAHSRTRWRIAIVIIAVTFGVLTVISGGRALFGDAAAQAAVGDAVPFVLWSNFVFGFLYVLAGIGVYLQYPWAAILSAAIAIMTILVFCAFGWHVVTGGAFEMRTVGAMFLRSGVWIAIAIYARTASTSDLPENGTANSDGNNEVNL
nr:MAG: hypothetical protein E4H34_01515 [Hyphomicrobiales bacterium]